MIESVYGMPLTELAKLDKNLRRNKFKNLQELNEQLENSVLYEGRLAFLEAKLQAIKNALNERAE
jgi:hypothetical protein